jgi:hypothetical protein
MAQESSNMRHSGIGEEVLASHVTRLKRQQRRWRPITSASIHQAFDAAAAFHFSMAAVNNLCLYMEHNTSRAWFLDRG